VWATDVPDGHVNPLEVAVRGTPEEVKDETLEVLRVLAVRESSFPSRRTSPGMPRENILAMLEALEDSTPNAPGSGGECREETTDADYP